MLAHRIAVIGAGYSGLTTAAYLTSLGHRAACVDKDALLASRRHRSRVAVEHCGLESPSIGLQPGIRGALKVTQQRGLVINVAVDAATGHR